MAGKILKYLSRPTSFSIPSSNSNKATFSGPILSLVPKEARRTKEKTGVEAFESEEEPTSPKVSCIGQVKHKHESKKSSSKKNKKHQSFNGREESKEKKKKPSAMLRMFRRKVSPGRPAAEGRMRRFASGREMLADFDWRKVMEEEEVMVAHSAPLVMGGGVAAAEKRKEVNLWKRRTLSPPEPVQVN